MVAVGVVTVLHLRQRSKQGQHLPGGVGHPLLARCGERSGELQVGLGAFHLSVSVMQRLEHRQAEQRNNRHQYQDDNARAQADIHFHALTRCGMGQRGRDAPGQAHMGRG